jgi:hypothetical protein
LEVVGGLRQENVANYFMRQTKCRKDLFLRRHAPALWVETRSQGSFWLGGTLFDNVTTDTHAYGEEGVRFYTKQKSIMQR